MRAATWGCPNSARAPPRALPSASTRSRHSVRPGAPPRRAVRSRSPVRAHCAGSTGSSPRGRRHRAAPRHQPRRAALRRSSRLRLGSYLARARRSVTCPTVAQQGMARLFRLRQRPQPAVERARLRDAGSAPSVFDQSRRFVPRAANRGLPTSSRADHGCCTRRSLADGVQTPAPLDGARSHRGCDQLGRKKGQVRARSTTIQHLTRIYGGSRPRGTG